MLRLPRPPVTKDELHALVIALWGVNLPRHRVCEHHVSPFDAFAEAFFGNKANWVLWYGSRGTGKSYMLAILALTKAAVLDINATLLGGSMAQSQNVHEHVESLLRYKHAPMYAIDRVIQTEITFKGGNWIRPLPASQKTVRGPHPHLTLLDEIDEMEKKIYDAAMGQAMAKPNTRGIVIPEMVVASSTWQNPIGTFEKVYNDAQRKGLPCRTWCWREVVKSEQNPDAWMEPAFIERKKQSVPAEMFRVEYELGEPAGTARAFDLVALNKTLNEEQPIRGHHKINDDLWVYEEPLKHATYATGADWAKESDKTVIATWRIDQKPARLVHLRSMNRKPWPEMINTFNAITKAYNGMSAHDATGIGNVVGDLIDERTIKMVMVGRDRTLMLTEYIAAVEQGTYSIPASAKEFYDQHKGTTVDDIYRSSTVSSAHLPDMVAAAALAHRAATRGGWVAGVEGVVKAKGEEERIQWRGLAAIDNPPAPQQRMELAGEVVLVEEPDDVGIFWLPEI